MKIRFEWMAILATVALAGCTKQENSNVPGSDPGPAPSGNVLSKPVFQVSPATVVLSEETAAQVALTMNWTAATTDPAVAVTYTVYANLASRDLFTNPQRIDPASPLSHSLTGETLNTLAKALGVTTQTSLKFAVYASASGMDSVVSDEVFVSVTPYDEEFVMPTHVYLIGSATDYGWDPAQGLSISGTNGVFTAQNVPLRTEPASANPSIKFAFSADGSDGRFAGQKTGASFGVVTVVETGEGYEFFPVRANPPYTNGTYTVSLNLVDMLLTLTRTGDLPPEDLPDHLYMLGGCFSWGWTWTGTTLDKVSDNIYEASNVTMNFNESDPQNPNGFKVFPKKDNWNTYYAMTDDATNSNVKFSLVETTDVPQFYPGKIGYASGVYDIRLDVTTYVATFTLTGGSGGDPSAPLYIAGDALSTGWTLTSVPSTGNGIYEMDVTLVLPAGYEQMGGFKFFSDTNWTEMYVADDASTHDNIIVVRKADYSGVVNDPQFFPGQLGYNVGNYHLVLNTNTMTLTLTAK